MPLQIDVITLFPDDCEQWFNHSIIGRARRAGLVELRAIDLREWAVDKHRSVDDRPYGGGPGMVLMAPIVAACLDDVFAGERPRLLMTTPQGRRFDQTYARELAAEDRRIVILCGHYEGIDERIVELYQPEEYSLGDYVLSGGELAALVLIDAVTRLQPGALGHADSAASDSFEDDGLLDHPCWTRPP